MKQSTKEQVEKIEQDIFQNKLLDRFDNLNEIKRYFLVIEN